MDGSRERRGKKVRRNYYILVERDASNGNPVFFSSNLFPFIVARYRERRTANNVLERNSIFDEFKEIVSEDERQRLHGG